VLESKFGDGYSERADDGLNYYDETWSLEWQISDTDRSTLITFFDNNHLGFLWTPPRHATQLKWKCFDYSYDMGEKTENRVSATFERIYDL
jgi:phage-related protein